MEGFDSLTPDMRLEKYDVIQLPGPAEGGHKYTPQGTIEPYCLVVLDAENFNRNNKLSFMTLELTTGKTYRTWLKSVGMTYNNFEKFVATLGPGIRVGAYISAISSQAGYQHMILSGIDLHRSNSPE